MRNSFTLNSRALVLTLAMGLGVPVVQAALPLEVNAQALPSLAPVVDKVSPAVVSIYVSGSKSSYQGITEPFSFFFGPDMPNAPAISRPFRGLGSGVIIDANKGYLITNAHVVSEADEIKISLKDGREFKAKKIGEDSQSDIALLQIEAKNLTAIKFANSDQLRVGDFAIAIGNPFGLGQTVTSGIISALGRSGLNLEKFEDFIQTDAAINSGNSGGALLNLRGELIGINTAIVAPSGGNVGVGFAIPANMVRNLSEQLIEFGEVKRGQLGIAGAELTPELAKTFGYEQQKGAFINQVMPNSPAEKAGIKAGDIITQIDGKPVQSFSGLRAQVATMGAGKSVQIGLFREGKELMVTAELKPAEVSLVQGEAAHPAFEGALLANSKEPEGVLVTDIKERSNAAIAGFKEGDLILAVNRVRIKNIEELNTMLKKSPALLALSIKRNETSIYLVFN